MDWPAESGPVCQRALHTGNGTSPSYKCVAVKTDGRAEPSKFFHIRYGITWVGVCPVESFVFPCFGFSLSE